MIVEYIVSFFLVIGGIFALVGSFGLIKLRDTMQRMHAPTKATTLGVGGVLIASMLYFFFVKDTLSFHELMISVFLFITAPITAHFMSQTHIRLNMKKRDLPDTETLCGWSIYDTPPVPEPEAKSEAS